MTVTVDAQAPRPSRSGLVFLIAAPVINSADDRWIDGFQWQPEIPVGASSIGIAACTGSNTERTPPTDQPGAQAFDPFIVWASERCSTKGRGVRDWMGRVRRALAAQESFLAAAEFWNGTIGNASGNKSLTSDTATEIHNAAVTPLEALERLDSALARTLRNRAGMIHMRPEVAVALVAGDALRYDAGSLYTPNANLVVADAGYSGKKYRANPGDAPGDVTTSQWMYGTDVVSVRLGQVETLPKTLDATVLAETVERDTNDMTVWAQRPIGIQWDYAAHLAIETDLDAFA